MSIKTLFQDIADAIKVKDTSIVTLTPAEMPDAIINIPSGGGGSENLIKYLSDYMTGKYLGGYEYAGNVNAAMISDLNLELLYDAHLGGETNITLLNNINNYSAILLNGIYKTQTTSNYNTTMLYTDVVLNHAYWAGMQDRNSTYDCFVTFTANNTATLSGNKQVMIYGLP